LFFFLDPSGASETAKVKGRKEGRFWPPTSTSTKGNTVVIELETGTPKSFLDKGIFCLKKAMNKGV
jgi:hypothetical protein